MVVGGILVFPAASSPSINKRISFDPKILFITFDIDPPMITVSASTKLRRACSQEALFSPLAQIVDRKPSATFFLDS